MMFKVIGVYRGLIDFLTRQAAILDFGAPREHASWNRADFYCGNCSEYHRANRFACSLCGDVQTLTYDVDMSVEASIELNDRWESFRKAHRHPE